MVVSPTRWRHLVGRFFGALGARVDSDCLRLLNWYLTPPERSLFLTMSVSDQRHSLDLCERLRFDGHTEPDLLRAALLHDVGKAAGSLPLLARVAYSLVVMTSPGIADWLCGSPTGWRSAFYLAAHHPEIGAAAAARAGASSRVVDLIAGHSDPGSDSLSRILYTYDRGM